MTVCRKPRSRRHSNHVVQQVTSLSNSTFFSCDDAVLLHDTFVL